MSRKSAEFSINQGKQFIGSLRIAAFDGLEDMWVTPLMLIRILNRISTPLGTKNPKMKFISVMHYSSPPDFSKCISASLFR